MTDKHVHTVLIYILKREVVVEIFMGIVTKIVVEIVV